MINIPSDSVAKFLAFAGLLAMSATCGWWFTANDKVLEARAVANGAQAELTALLDRYVEMGDEMRPQISRALELYAAIQARSKKGTTNNKTLESELGATNEFINAQVSRAQAVKARMDEKRIVAATLEATAATHQRVHEQNSALAAVGFFCGLLSLVVGCLWWALSAKATASKMPPLPRIER